MAMNTAGLFAELAGEVATEARLLRAIQAALAVHAAARVRHYRRVDPGVPAAGQRLGRRAGRCSTTASEDGTNSLS
jgi:hypothetical protein